MDVPKSRKRRARELRSAAEIIVECERLSQPTVPTTMEELATLQQDAVYCLLSLGPRVEGIRKHVEELRFNPIRPPIWPLARTGQPIDTSTRFRDATSFDNYVSGILNQLKELMLLARPKRKEKIIADYADKRKQAILALCAIHRSDKDYIEKICADLQRQRILLLAHWVKEWNKVYSLGLQNWDWAVAYRSGQKPIRTKIQKHISNVCNPRLHTAN
jgi:hypothetical protein